jgi:DeoR/GlpR family transcriptional regulator of sugar metabolism
MAINEAVNIDIDVNGTSTVKQAANAYEDLGDAVSKTQLEAEKLAQQFGINDKRTQEAIKVAGRYKQQMEDLDFAIDGARGGTDQMFRAAQGVAAGFELAAGATALFGSESEQLEKILVRVQGALVFSQGLRDLKEFTPAIKNVATATKEWWLSLSLVQKAFVSIGVGLLIDLIYKLSVEFQRLSENVTFTDEAFENMAETIGDSISNVDRLTNAVQDQTLSEQDRLKALRELQELYPNYFSNIGNDINDTEALQKAKDKLVDSLVREAKVKALQEQISEIYKEDIAEELKLTEEINVQRDAAAANQEKLNKQLAEGKITQSDYNTGLAQANQQTLKAERLEKQLLDIQTEREKKVGKLSKLINDNTAIIIKNGGATDNQTKSIKQNTKAIENNLLTSEKLKGQSIENVTDIGEATMRTTNATLSFVETEQKSFFERSRLFIGAYGEDVSNTLKDVLAVSTEFTLNMSDKATQDYQKRIDKLKELGYTEEQISNMRDKELLKIDERGRKAFEIQKRLRYAQTLISSIEGTQNAYTTAQESPITAIVPVYPLIQAGLAAAFGIAQLQQISQSSYESQDRPSISSASAGGGFNGRFNAPSVRLPRTEQFTGQQRIYVTEYDISNTQEKVKVTEDVSIVK